MCLLFFAGVEEHRGRCFVWSQMTHIARVILWINQQVRLVGNPARGQLNRENEHFPVLPFAPVKLVSRDGFGRPVSASLLILHTQAEFGPYTGFPPISAAASIYLFTPAIRHRASPEFIGSRNCVPMAFIAECPPAQGQ